MYQNRNWKLAVFRSSLYCANAFTNSSGENDWLTRKFSTLLTNGARPGRVTRLRVMFGSKSSVRPTSTLTFRRTVWRAPQSGPYSRQIWAPELHWLDGHWYIYVAASDGDNRNHRTIVLESRTGVPLEPFEFRAELFTGDPGDGQPNRWAIDSTVCEWQGVRYLFWSGWEQDQDVQYLYAARLRTPWEIGGPRVRLCDNQTYTWERVSESPLERGLHEAPQPLVHGDRLMLVYSCCGAWQQYYKLGLLVLRQGGDPLVPEDWQKLPDPVFRASATTRGVGHCCFTQSPDGREDWLIYHAKRNVTDGWERDIYAQRFSWNGNGLPEFGLPLPAGTALPALSGARP